MNRFRIKIVYPLAVLVLIMAGAWSCNDAFDEHYKADESVASTQTLMELIDQQPDLSRFASMVRAVSYDSVLSGSQSYTVWAPVNATLQAVDMNDKEELLNIVTNHIARFTYSASDNRDENIYMLNGKTIRFDYTGGSYRLGGFPLVASGSNRNAKNGLLHTLDGMVPFRRNIWEYMLYPEFDSIRSYLYSFNEKRFLLDQSPSIDVQDGLIIYDSIFSASNTMWYTNPGSKGVGWLNNEDSIYTMIFPTNAAWEEAYTRIAPYYRSNNPLIADSLQRTNTKYAIVQDLVFRGIQNAPESLGAADSLVSTRNSVFHDPAHLFTDATPREVSNGLVYPVNRLSYNAWESWQKPILIEAEYPVGRDIDPKKGDFRRHYAEDRPDISNYGYLEIFSLTASAATRVDAIFEIPDILAGSYNIYCVFLPQTVPYPQEANPKKTRVRCEISQLNRLTNVWTPMASGGGMGATIVPENDGVTNPTEITKMSVSKGFRFPYSSVGELQNTVRIKITTFLATNASQAEWENRMYIDCIILEPVH